MVITEGYKKVPVIAKFLTKSWSFGDGEADNLLSDYSKTLGEDETKHITFKGRCRFNIFIPQI